MMTLTDIFMDCESKNIDVDYFPMNKAVSLSFPKGFIAVDIDKVETSIKEKEIIAHEESHIETGSFYNFHSPIDLKEKHERRAEVHTIKKLVPLDELKEAVAYGFTEAWELADYFEVSCEFMAKALEYYSDNQLLR